MVTNPFLQQSSGIISWKITSHSPPIEGPQLHRAMFTLKAGLTFPPITWISMTFPQLFYLLGDCRLRWMCIPLSITHFPCPPLYVVIWIIAGGSPLPCNYKCLSSMFMLTIPLCHCCPLQYGTTIVHQHGCQYGGVCYSCCWCWGHHSCMRLRRFSAKHWAFILLAGDWRSMDSCCHARGGSLLIFY